MRYLIEHETILDYPTPVREHHLELRLTPRQDAGQRLISHRIELEPAAERHSYQDYFGNGVDYFCVTAPHTCLITRLTAEVETLRENPELRISKRNGMPGNCARPRRCTITCCTAAA